MMRACCCRDWRADDSGRLPLAVHGDGMGDKRTPRFAGSVQRPCDAHRGLDFIADAFVGEPVDRATLLRTARAAHARPELLRVLEQLPELKVTELAQLWTVLDVPEDLSAIDEA
jgi:Protein of unknown function (DUF2795)